MGTNLAVITRQIFPCPDTNPHWPFRGLDGESGVLRKAGRLLGGPSLCCWLRAGVFMQAVV